MKITISLSKIARGPIIAAFMERGERDQGPQPATPALRRPVLTDGAAENVKETVDA
ncbi:hypothetical protein [Mesorhizobium sp. Mes31]|uniref:hypothetical protein n=1 Tax=Mesorhizobium sp. Mes31 TaxID=2926017 RepID=UPI00211951B1|nr:hypothetical protein [Mesorhizobium sp. Mes31]